VSGPEAPRSTTRLHQSDQSPRQTIKKRAHAYYPLLVTYWEMGLLPRLPTVVLVTGVMLLSLLRFACGLILGSVSRGCHELEPLHYLGVPAPATRAGSARPDGV
jgi:hypothetical protein